VLVQGPKASWMCSSGGIKVEQKDGNIRGHPGERFQGPRVHGLARAL